jgi:hypothetical protein
MDLRIVVCVEINRAWRNNAASGVNLLIGGRVFQRADLRDSAAFDADVRPITGRAGTVNDDAAPDQNVKVRHDAFPNSLSMKWSKIILQPLPEQARRALAI